MSDKSNNQGRAFEYACLKTLENEINKHRKAIIINNSSFLASLRAWNQIDDNLKEELLISANAMIGTIFDIEPLMVEDDNDTLELLIQSDDNGVDGDVRDILAIREKINWEIGFSVKHNHFAVKHSRLGKNLDFGERWYGIKCSEKYWSEISNIFKYLQSEKEKNTKWCDLPAKEQDVYIPLLKAFVSEIKRAYEKHDELPSKMVEYLLGKFDFYKIIGIDNKKITQIQGYNLRGTLNKDGKKSKPKIKVPIANLPTRLVSIDLKPNSTNKVEMYFDNGWQFSFRIHNASTYVEPSLKFDIQIEGVPASIIAINCLWSSSMSDIDLSHYMVAESDDSYNE